MPWLAGSTAGTGAVMLFPARKIIAVPSRVIKSGSGQ